MTTYTQLTHAQVDSVQDILTLSSDDNVLTLTFNRAGDYLLLYVDYGPLEMGVRVVTTELARLLPRLVPLDDRRTTRQIGDGQTHLGLGALTDGSLLLKPTLVADARGHLTFHLLISPEASQALYRWLPVEIVTSTAEVPRVQG